MSASRWAFAAALLPASLLPAALGAQAVPYDSPPEDLPRAVAPQPIPFDHSRHMEQGMACADCHPGATGSERAGLPDRDRCMLCHQAVAADSEGVRNLSELPRGARIPWVRVYRVPGFVFFSHAAHAAAKVGCETCHGPVGSRSVLSQEVSTKMVACMNCHAARQASNECYLCHDLGQ